VSKQPPGWVKATLADVTEYISRGKSPKYTHHSSLPVVNQRAIRWFGIQQEHLKYVDPAQFDLWTPERFIRIWDVLWNSTGTGTIGRACLVTQRDVEPPKVVDSHVTIVRPNQAAIEPRFLFSWIQSPEIQENISSLATGTTNQIELSRLAIASIQIPIAPLNEQKRIADKLNALLARVDACRERLDRIPLILKRFRQVVLAVATSGQLTEDWRTSRESTQWQRMSLSEICLSITDGDHQAPPQAKRGVPFITIAAINDGRLRIDKATRFVPSVYFEQMKASRKPEMGDILFSVTGSIAISALVDTREPFTFQRHIAILKPDLSRISSSFLRYALETEDIKRQALSVATGTAQLTVPLSGLRAFMLDIPARDEQDEIVSRVEAIFAYADRLEARYQAARTQVDRLTPALLTKAFRGELVPQDPNDEPASVLLERIRAERAAQPAKPKRSQASRKQTMTKMTEESVKEAISQLPKDKFSFDELRENISGDYDSLKDILFALLSEAEPSLTQVFDRAEQTMRFVRAGK